MERETAGWEDQFRYPGSWLKGWAVVTEKGVWGDIETAEPVGSQLVLYQWQWRMHQRWLCFVAWILSSCLGHSWFALRMGNLLHGMKPCFCHHQRRLELLGLHSLGINLAIWDLVGASLLDRATLWMDPGVVSSSGSGGRKALLSQAAEGLQEGIKMPTPFIHSCSACPCSGCPVAQLAEIHPQTSPSPPRPHLQTQNGTCGPGWGKEP